MLDCFESLEGGFEPKSPSFLYGSAVRLPQLCNLTEYDICGL
jgi:hypothetical protein